MSNLTRPKGFSVIELMVTVAIAAIVLALAAPSVSDWLKNQAVQGAAQSVQNGIRAAQAEAMKRNAQVEFSLTNNLAVPSNVTSATPSPSGQNWIVRVPGSPATWIAGEVAAQAYPYAKISAGSASLFFNGIGQVTTDSAQTAPVFSNALFRVARADNLQRAYCVYLTPGKAVKMCDAAIASSSDSRSCAFVGIPTNSAATCAAPDKPHS